jgi:hypothetical protein
VWCLLSGVVSFGATRALVDVAVALPPGDEINSDYLARWAIVTGGSLLALALIAGLVVFDRTAPWEVLLTWPWLVGFAIALGAYIALGDQMNGGSQLCEQPAGTSCDTAWGFGAMILGVGTGIVFGSVCLAAAAVRRLAPWPSRTQA